MLNTYIKFVIYRIIEFIKFDFNQYKYPLVVSTNVITSLLSLFGKKYLAFTIVSGVFRTGWAGSYSLGLKYSRSIFLNARHSQLIYSEFINNIEVIDRTRKFFDAPHKLLDGIITVLKSPGNNEKGALIINYNYYFPMFLKFFDVAEISKRYNIILEPSWAGFCDLSILSFNTLDQSIYLMTYEKRDRKFIDDFNGNFIPINIGPNWFVNYRYFSQPKANTHRDIDIIMVAGWAKFKRHESFFKCISKMKKLGRSLNICLVGYPTDMTKEEIVYLAKRHDIYDQIQIHEWIKPQAVADLYRRSKINILWSKFEGNNRAIIEGMLCGTPVILRKGHNYGDDYDFINPNTGHFSDEKSLASTIELMLGNNEDYKPREYILNNRSCTIATSIMSSAIKEDEIRAGRLWTCDLAVKTNELHSMNYFEDKNKNKFIKDYEYLTSKIVTPYEY